MSNSVMEDTTLRESNKLEAKKILHSSFDIDEEKVYSFVVTNTASYNTATVLGSGGVPNMIGGYNLKGDIIITNKNFYILQCDVFNKYLSHNKIPFNELIIKLEGKYFKLYLSDRLIYEGMIHEENAQEIIGYLSSKGATINTRNYKYVLTWMRNNKGLTFVMILFSYVIIAPIYMALRLIIAKIIELLF